ncbi:MAG TPA: ammonium transporter, partial [Nitrospinae bacterium]|nr:ammonium transporter [Nitrospinota bacterium]
SVHLVCGVFGTVALGLFGVPKLTGGAAGLFYGGGVTFLFKQITGVLAVGAFTFILSLILWNVVKALMGMRVDIESEHTGLDLTEHGMEAYPE